MSWKVWDGKFTSGCERRPFVRVHSNGRTGVSVSITRRLGNPIQVLIDRDEGKFAFRTDETGGFKFQPSGRNTVLHLTGIFDDIGFKVDTSRRIYGKWSEGDSGLMVEFDTSCQGT